MKEADSFVTTITKDFGKMLAWGMVNYGFAVCSESDSVTTNY
jgi:hypothetical protein